MILRDLATEKQLEKEREAARRMQALAEMSTLLAHEIRNPLGSLELFAGLLAGTVESQTPQSRWTGQLQAGLRQLSATVNNVLELHSRPPEERIRVDLVSLLTETVEFLTPLARQWEAHIEFRPLPPEAMVLAEPNSLRQVFLNLAINAFRAMSPGGKLRIRVTIGRTCQVPTVQIEFADQGQGILPEHLEKVFDAGFTTRPSGPGLGLAVSKRIVEQHEGSISVRSTPGAGTTFLLNFREWES